MPSRWDGSTSNPEAPPAPTPPPSDEPIEVSFVSIANEDGWLRERSENADVGGKRNIGARGSKSIRIGDDKKDRQYRSLLSFDTSSLPQGASILSAQLELTRGGNTGQNPFNTHGRLYIDSRFA